MAHPRSDLPGEKEGCIRMLQLRLFLPSGWQNGREASADRSDLPGRGVRRPAETYKKTREKGRRERPHVPPDGGVDKRPEKKGLGRAKRPSQLAIPGTRHWEWRRLHDGLHLYPASAGLSPEERHLPRPGDQFDSGEVMIVPERSMENPAPGAISERTRGGIYGKGNRENPRGASAPG